MAKHIHTVSQIDGLLRDSKLVEEMRSLLNRGRNLPNADQWSIKRETIASVLNNKAVTGRDFATRPFTEAIVLLHGRPALLVRNDTFELPRSSEWRDRLLPAKSRLEYALRSVGRIELEDHPNFPWVGTGWILAPGILVTNRHVAMEFARRKGAKFRFITTPLGRQVRARIDFKEEYRSSETAEIDIAEVLHIEPDDDGKPDLAILKLASDSAEPPPIPLAQDNVGANRDIAVIGYPARDSRNASEALSKVFGDIYDVKRLSPGQVTQVKPTDAFFLHDCSTLGGNSGSAVVSVDGGEVVGVHFGGQFQATNYAVSVSALRAVAKRARVKIPSIRPHAIVVASRLSEARRRSDVRPPSHFAGRKGYDKNFLGSGRFAVPLPRPTSSNALAAVEGNAENRLDYMHFSVLQHSRRRLPFLTAVNINGQELRNFPRDDKWYLDGRLELEHQIGNELYANNDLDRGHMVRRLDPVWGSREEAMQANDDTFVYTNSCPQHKDLNQRTWNDLEDYILGNAGVHDLKVSVFTGPVLGDNDPEYRNIRLPREFWKVAVMVRADTGKLSATGYMLSQATMLRDLDEGFSYGRFRTYQVPIAKIEQLTKIKFKLSAVDPMHGESHKERLGAGPSSRLIESAGDIRFV
jgi:endonuclease G